MSSPRRMAAEDRNFPTAENRPAFEQFWPESGGCVGLFGLGSGRQAEGGRAEGQGGGRPDEVSARFQPKRNRGVPAQRHSTEPKIRFGRSGRQSSTETSSPPTRSAVGKMQEPRANDGAGLILKATPRQRGRTTHGPGRSSGDAAFGCSSPVKRVVRRAGAEGYRASFLAGKARATLNELLNITMSCVPVAGDGDGICANCGKHGSDTVKLKNCTACRLVKYCGVDCQRDHRKQHKKTCKQRAAELKDEELY
ncbi:hypothetical protein THAOC_37324, partial [Thalassiosira oceanica]